MYERDAAKLVAAQLLMEKNEDSKDLPKSSQQAVAITREEFLQGLLQSSRDFVARGKLKALKWPILKIWSYYRHKITPVTSKHSHIKSLTNLCTMINGCACVAVRMMLYILPN